MRRTGGRDPRRSVGSASLFVGALARVLKLERLPDRLGALGGMRFSDAYDVRRDAGVDFAAIVSISTAPDPRRHPARRRALAKRGLPVSASNPSLPSGQLRASRALARVVGSASSPRAVRRLHSPVSMLWLRWLIPYLAALPDDRRQGPRAL